jgi:hypothetical protein
VEYINHEAFMQHPALPSTVAGTKINIKMPNFSLEN